MRNPINYRSRQRERIMRGEYGPTPDQIDVVETLEDIRRRDNARAIQERRHEDSLAICLIAFIAICAIAAMLMIRSS